jgi:hypothetical protein
MEHAERIRAIAEAVFGPQNPRHRDFQVYGWHVAPDIPEKKLTGACEAYARMDFTREAPLVLGDDTVFGSAKRGLLVTTRALHFCVTNPVDGFSDYKGTLPLEAIHAFRVIGDALYVNDEKLGTITQPPEAVVLALETFFARLAGGGPVGRGAPDGPRAGTREAIVETIRVLKGLHDEGALTADEFTEKKRELLARL